MASQYRERFGKVTSQLATLVQDRRLWISDKWTDTEAGKEQDLKMLEYACGPGAVSMVSCSDAAGSSMPRNPDV